MRTPELDKGRMAFLGQGTALALREPCTLGLKEDSVSQGQGMGGNVVRRAAERALKSSPSGDCRPAVPMPEEVCGPENNTGLSKAFKTPW